MENELKDKVNKFLQIDNDYGSGYGYSYGSGYGSGYGFGYGNGSGSGSGDGSGSGSGSGDGYGSGDGDGNGSGSGSGDGSGYGSGSGYGNGSGSGSGDGDGIQIFNNYKIYFIDGIQTIIKSIFKGVAKGFILNSDLSLEKCYVVKNHNNFAHGKTIKDAMKSLESKIFANMNIKDRINSFKDKFSVDKKYKGTTFYEWHNKLTGSCEMGRNNFVKNNNINLNKLYSVKEFIELTENNYGEEIIKQLKEYYE